MSCIFNPGNNELWWVMPWIITMTKRGKLMLVSLWYMTKPFLVSDAFFFKSVRRWRRFCYHCPGVWHHSIFRYRITPLCLYRSIKFDFIYYYMLVTGQLVNNSFVNWQLCSDVISGPFTYKKLKLGVSMVNTGLSKDRLLDGYLWDISTRQWRANANKGNRLSLRSWSINQFTCLNDGCSSCICTLP